MRDYNTTAGLNLHEVAAGKEQQKTFLYRIQDPDGGSDILLTNSRSNIVFPSSPGTDTYLYITPIQNQLPGESADGKTGTGSLSVAVNDVWAARIKQHNYMKGMAVTITQVWINHLGDAEAKVTYKLTIDSGDVTGRVATFQLKSRLDIMEATIAPRTYNRNHCPWATGSQGQYKGHGCWEEDGSGGYVAPAGFIAGSPDTCDGSHSDCIRHNNIPMNGTFPAIPKRKLVQI